MNMRNILVLAATATLVACGGGGSGSGGAAPMSNANPPMTQVPPTSPSTTPPVSSGDLALADRLYKGTQRTPDGFDVESRPANVSGTLSTRHLKNTDFMSGGQQAISQAWEICTNDMAQAIAWSEQLANWNGQYSDLVEVHGDSRLWEVVRVPRADTTAMLRHRVFRCDYLDRTNTDLRADAGAAGSMNQRPLTASELDALAEYLWQFTMFNNSDYVVESSTGAASGNTLTHTIRLGQMVRGVSGACDTVQLSDWTHTMSTTDGSLTRSLTNTRSFKVKSVGGSVEGCAG